MDDLRKALAQQIMDLSKIIENRERAALDACFNAKTADDAQYQKGYADGLHAAWNILTDEIPRIYKDGGRAE